MIWKDERLPMGKSSHGGGGDEWLSFKFRDVTETTSWKRLVFFERFFSIVFVVVNFLFVIFVLTWENRLCVVGRKSSWSVFSIELLTNAANRPNETRCWVEVFSKTKLIIKKQNDF